MSTIEQVKDRCRALAEHAAKCSMANVDWSDCDECFGLEAMAQDEASGARQRGIHLLVDYRLDGSVALFESRNGEDVILEEWKRPT